MNTMEEEFKVIIEKNLPAQVGEALQKRLLQADEDAASVKRLRETVADLQKVESTLLNTVEGYQEFDARNAAMEERERALANQEREFRLHTLEYQIAAEREKTKFSQDVAMGLVRNTKYRSQIFDNEFETNGHYDAHNNWVAPKNVTKTYTEDKSAE